MLFKFAALAIGGFVFFAAMPATSTYKLNSYDFGSGGGNQGTSSYSVEGITGQAGSGSTNTSTYTVKAGFIQTQQAHVPQISSFDNNSGAYSDKLHFVIDTQGNPTDALYALQISTDSTFATNINYVKSDMTIGTTLTLTDYQTYAAFGGSGGANILGLSANTTYYLRAKATQGKYTESSFGPSLSATTANNTQTISFCVYTGANCAAGGAAVSFSGVVPNTTVDGSNTIKADFATNASNGGKVYIYSSNGGLKSASAGNYLIQLSSSQVDLSSGGEGFGARGTATQTSGGPFAPVSPYDSVSSTTVGKINTTVSEAFSSSSSLVGGTGTLTLKLRTVTSTPSANDYADVITLIAAASY